MKSSSKRFHRKALSGGRPFWVTYGEIQQARLEALARLLDRHRPDRPKDGEPEKDRAR
jgi:hypothetical protein